MKNYCFEYEMAVRDYECDMQGIVNNAIYQNYFEHVRHEFLKSLDSSFVKMHEELGIDPVVSRIVIDYKTSLRSGDRFVCKLSMAREGARYLFFQDLFRLPDLVVCAKARVEIASLKNGRLIKGDEMLHLFEKFI